MVKREVDVGAFFEYLEQIVFEVDSGRLKASEVRRRLISDWGGTRVSGYVPQRDPLERRQIRELCQSGVPERSARAKVRGK